MEGAQDKPGAKAGPCLPGAGGRPLGAGGPAVTCDTKTTHLTSATQRPQGKSCVLAQLRLRTPAEVTGSPLPRHERHTRVRDAEDRVSCTVAFHREHELPGV